MHLHRLLALCLVITVQCMSDFEARHLLKLKRGASPDDIKKQYYRLALKCHPDKGGDPKEFVRINEAYETLTGGASRRRKQKKDSAGRRSGDQRSGGSSSSSSSSSSSRSSRSGNSGDGGGDDKSGREDFMDALLRAMKRFDDNFGEEINCFRSLPTAAAWSDAASLKRALDCLARNRMTRSGGEGGASTTENSYAVDLFTSAASSAVAKLNLGQKPWFQSLTSAARIKIGGSSISYAELRELYRQYQKTEKEAAADDSSSADGGDTGSNDDSNRSRRGSGEL